MSDRFTHVNYNGAQFKAEVVWEHGGPGYRAEWVVGTVEFVEFETPDDEAEWREFSPLSPSDWLDEQWNDELCSYILETHAHDQDDYDRW